MLLIWLHGVKKDESPTKCLFEALVAIDKRDLAGQYKSSRLGILVFPFFEFSILVTKLCLPVFRSFSCQVTQSQHCSFHHNLIIKNTLKLVAKFNV